MLKDTAINNEDEDLEFDLKYSPASTKSDVIGIGNFHKTLPHNEFGEVDPVAYETFKTVATTGGDYETVPRGPVGTGYVVTPAPTVGDKFNDPQAARLQDGLTGPTTDYSMPPAPSFRSLSTAAEMTELQWMALLRDLPFVEFDSSDVVDDAVEDIRSQFQSALDAHEHGGLRLGSDLPSDGTDLDLTKKTLFRCGLPGEAKGPIVSQFFLHDIAYGAQFIQQKVRPYAKGVNFLTDYESWLRAQNAGLDKWADGYSNDNNFEKAPELEDTTGPRHLSNMRDIARFVNKDALHQAYFNAALLCLSWGMPFDPGNPYSTYKRQAGFGTFGGPDLLTRVSEVAGRALAIVWRQKWEIHRRLRPEAYGGLMQMQKFGPPGTTGKTRAYGLPDDVFTSEAAKRLLDPATGTGNYFLPIAFTAGSPPHPSYGAGHATVAGACVTVIKAWVAGDTKLNAFFTDPKTRKRTPYRETDPNKAFVFIAEADETGELVPYNGNDIDEITLEGELNKIACNVAMGRSMGGVHWRTDNTRSLRLGEQIAAEVIRSESLQYAEKRVGGDPEPYWTFTSFNGDSVRISNGKVRVNGAIVDPKAGPI